MLESVVIQGVPDVPERVEPADVIAARHDDVPAVRGVIGLADR